MDVHTEKTLVSMKSRLRSLTKLESTVYDLYSIIKDMPDILQKIDALPFENTPLHEASAAGKIDIAMELMNLKPSFAKKLNADGFSPLHVAIENGKDVLALQLIKRDPSLIRFPGREGMTPLHLVAKKGGVDLLAKFIMECPESIRDTTFNGETALHITIKNDKYEELRVLLGWMQKFRSHDALATEIHVLNSCDLQGNTALHLACHYMSENSRKVVRQLLNCMSLNPNIVNKDDKTPLDVLRDNGAHMNKYTEKLIRNSGGKTKKSIEVKYEPLSDRLRAPIDFWIYCATIMARYRSQMSEGTRNSILVITALIITAAYTTAVQQEDKIEDKTIIELLDRVTLNVTELNITLNSRKYGYDTQNMVKIDVADITMDEANTAAILNSTQFKDKKRAIVMGMVALWGCNSTAYLLSVAWTFILLPAGREYVCGYIVIIGPLTVSFALSTYRKYNIYGFSIHDYGKSLLINIYLIVLVLFSVYVFVVYVRWKRSRPMKNVSEPKAKQLSQGWKSWCYSPC